MVFTKGRDLLAKVATNDSPQGEEQHHEGNTRNNKVTPIQKVAVYKK